MSNLQGSVMSIFGEEGASTREDLEVKMKELGDKLALLGETLVQKKAQGEEKIEETVQAIQITKEAFLDTQKALDNLGKETAFPETRTLSGGSQSTKQVLTETQKEFSQTQKALESAQKELAEMKGVLENIDKGSGSIFSFFGQEKEETETSTDESLTAVKEELAQLKEALQGLQNSSSSSGTALEALKEQAKVCD
ncbi:hypothetical protein K9M41_01125 [Candidatus Gracilibacteria bacterium]|nr:hypothetical protein [Candidatus Gracilibacteria bacterium]